MSVSRRGFLHVALVLAASGAALSACRRHEPLLRLAMHSWPGYEFIHLARARDYFTDDMIRLVETHSATTSLQALAAGNVEAACLTLDEVLTARADGLDLVVVAVLDVSHGADVLLARPPLSGLHELKGKRIGVEQSALGAVMLEAILRRAALAPDAVHLVEVTFDEHQTAYVRGTVDALITFEPAASQLLRQGAHVLFSSADIPGRIVDVLAVQRTALATHPEALRALLAGHFRARELYLAQPAQYAGFLASRLQLDVAQLPAMFAGLALTDVAQNRAWLGPSPSRLETRAGELEIIMRQAGLLPRPVSLARLSDARFLPEGARP